MYTTYRQNQCSSGETAECQQQAHIVVFTLDVMGNATRLLLF